jgi:hypothetical protein
MAAGVVCQIGDDSHIWRIFPKEDRCDSGEVILTADRDCVAPARPGSSAGKCRHIEQENETIYRVIAIAYT